QGADHPDRVGRLDDPVVVGEAPSGHRPAGRAVPEPAAAARAHAAGGAARAAAEEDLARAPSRDLAAVRRARRHREALPSGGFAPRRAKPVEPPPGGFAPRRAKPVEPPPGGFAPRRAKPVEPPPGGFAPRRAKPVEPPQSRPAHRADRE